MGATTAGTQAQAKAGDDGTAARTGRSDQPKGVAWFTLEKARGIANGYGDPLAKVLVDDAADELEQLKERPKTQAQKDRLARTDPDYFEFKPLVLFIGDAAKKIFEGLGYVEADEAARKLGKTRTLDLTKMDGSKVLDGFADLVECVYKKEKVRARFFDALSDWTKKKLAGGGLVASDRTTGKQKATIDARAGAVCDLLVGVFRLWAEIRALNEPKKDDGQAKTTGDKAKDWKALLDNVATIVGAVVTLCGSRVGVKFIRRLAGDLKTNTHLHKERSQRLEKRLDEIRGLTPEEKRAKAAERRDADRKDFEKRRETPESKLVGDEIARCLKGIAHIIEQAGAFWDAFVEVFPEDLAGEWAIEGLPDPDRVWTMKLEREGDADAYKGTISAVGYPAGKNSLGTDPPVREEKADVVLKRVAGADAYELCWTPKVTGAPKLPVLGDKAFAAGACVVERLTLVSTRSLESAAPTPFGQQPTVTAPIRFGRVQAVTKWFNLVMAGFKVVAAVPDALPAKWRNELDAWIRGRFGPTLTAWQTRFLPKAVQKYGRIACADGRLTLGFSFKSTFALSATWDLAKILEWAFAEPAARSATATPWVPVACEGTIKVPKLPVDVTIKLEPHDPASKAGAEAGKQGMEEKLDAFPWKHDLDAYLASLGAKVDLLEPILRGGDVSRGDLLPALVIPIVLYLEEYQSKVGDKVEKWRWFVKITCGLGISAEVFASYFPHVRAALFAWQAGWAVGTFLREEVLLRFDWYRAGEAGFQDLVLKWFYGIDTEFEKQVEVLERAIQDRFRRGFITGYEQQIALLKAPLYLWRRDGRDGFPASLDQAIAAKFREGIERRIHLAKGLPAPADWARGYGDPRNPFYVNTEAQGLLYLHLFGQGTAPPRDRIQAAIEKAVKRKDLLQATAWLYLTYLFPEQYPDHHARITGMAISRRGNYGAVEEKRVFETTRYGVPVLTFKEFVDLIATPWPDIAYRDDFKIYKLPQSGYRWRVERKAANEPVSLRFLETAYVNDVLVTDAGQEALPGYAYRHYIEGSFEGMRASLNRFKDRDGRIEVYVEVRDPAGTRVLWKSPAWKLAVAPSGDVLDAVPS